MKECNNIPVKLNLLFRHGLISITCASTEFSLFILLFSYLGLPLPVAYIFSFCVATCIGFVGHSIFTFKVGRLYRRNALFFVIQACCALMLGYLIVSSLIQSGMFPSFAKGIQLVLIFFFNVFFGKFLSFKKQD